MAECLRIQLRGALHVGPVFADAHGVSGRAVLDTARLLDAAPLKEALATSGADLGVIVSGFVHDLLAEHHSGLLDPDSFAPVRVTVKEYDVAAWMHLSDQPAAKPAPVRPPAEPPAPVSAGPVFSGEVRVSGDLVLGNKLEFHS